MSKYDNNLSNGEINVNDIIIENENIIWQGKPKKSAFIINKALTMLPFALIWLLFDGFFIVAIISSGDTNALWFIIPFFGLHMMPVWIWLGNIITANKKWQNTHYIVTDKRILIISGFIGMNYITLYYKDIKNVYLNVSAIDKLLKVGDIYFNANSSINSFLDIENAYELYPKIQKIVLDIQTDIQYPNNLRPELNDGYKTRYDR